MGRKFKKIGPVLCAHMCVRAAEAVIKIGPFPVLNKLMVGIYWPFIMIVPFSCMETRGRVSVQTTCLYLNISLKWQKADVHLNPS